MKSIKALLVGVSQNYVNGCANIPTVLNDIAAMKSALINGLNMTDSNISVCGKNGFVTLENLNDSLNFIIHNISKDDTFIFYFSGHGGENILALSYDMISLQSLIDLIEQIPAKNKLIILDSCHSGGFVLKNPPDITIANTIEKFCDYGYAVMASCGACQSSGFDSYRGLSLYTRFVVDALTCKCLIKKGRKSLEDINDAIFHYAEVANNSDKYQIKQHPIFRSNLGGTIFFNVQDYTPYKSRTVYEEYDRYIIYAVEPVHHVLTKRYSVKVILRYLSSLAEIAEIEKEIVTNLRYCDVYKNPISEKNLIGKPSNVIWCYFGYDENDMINSNFYCRTTWIDDTQDKAWWYKTTKNSKIIEKVFFNDINSSYSLIKEITEQSVDKTKLIYETQKYTEELINSATQVITLYREYANHVLTENELLEKMDPINKIIQNVFMKQSELPYPPLDLIEWSNAHSAISGTIHDFSLFYNREYISKWDSSNRKYLMADKIKQYYLDLENLKNVESTIK